MDNPCLFIRFVFLLVALLLPCGCFASADDIDAAAQAGVSAPPSPTAGERLVYEVRWDPPWYFFFLPTMKAGQIEIMLQEEAGGEKDNRVKIVFEARSSGTLAKMSGIKVEDTFIFIAEPKTLCSLKASKKIREGKRKRQIDVEYFRDKNQLHIREVDEAVVPPKVKKDQVKNKIPSCVYDPFSAIYLLRSSELEPKQVRTFLIGFDDRVNKIESRVEGEDTVKTPAGKFPAWQISTTSLVGGLFKGGGQFSLWLSSDEKKIPVQFEAKVKLGRVLGKLTEYESPFPDERH
jgi:hypothetical protein